MNKKRDGFKTHKFDCRPFGNYKRRYLYKQTERDDLWAVGPLLLNTSDTLHSPFNLNFYRGDTMKIKFSGMKKYTTSPNPKGRTFEMIQVSGTAIGGKLDGQEYTTKFFANNKELKGQVEAFSPGEIVDIEMKKNGQFWNPVKFTSEGMAPSAAASGGTSATAPVMAATNQRFENLKLAVEILGTKLTDQDTFEYLQDAAGVADMIQNYIDEKGAFQFANTSDDIPFGEEEDPE